MMTPQTILIHADGTIQCHPARGRRFRLGNKTFRIADQAYNDQELGPIVYTETTTDSESMVNNVIPFRPRQSDLDENPLRPAYAS